MNEKVKTPVDPYTGDSTANFAQGTLVMKKIHTLRNEVGEVEASRMDKAGMRYNYLSERALTTTVRPVMQKLGLVAVPVKSVSRTKSYEVGEKDGVMRYVLLTEVSKVYLVMDIESGDYIEVSVEGSGADVMDKGTNKASTCAVKNFYKELLNIPSPEKDDPDTTPSTYNNANAGYIKRSFNDPGSATLKFGEFAGKTIREVYEMNPEAVKKMAESKSAWLSERATEFLKTVA